MLPNTNITTMMVANEIGENKYDVASLCKSSNINMFSKNKPVLGIFPSSSNNCYGLDIPAYNWALNNNWSYIRPVAEYRLGDFRSYNHQANIPIGVKAASFPVKHNIWNGNLIITAEIGSDLSLSDLGLSNKFLSIDIQKQNGSIVSVSGDSDDCVIIPFKHPRLDDCIGSLKYKLYLSNIMIGIDDQSVSIVKTSIPHITHKGVQYINNGILLVENISTLMAQLIGIYGSISSIETFVSPDTEISSSGSITIKVALSSSGISETISDANGYTLQFIGGFFGENYSVNVGATMYDANNSVKISSAIINASVTTLCFRCNNVLNRKNGLATGGASGVYEVGIMLFKNGRFVCGFESIIANAGNINN